MKDTQRDEESPISWKLVVFAILMAILCWLRNSDFETMQQNTEKLTNKMFGK